MNTLLESTLTKPEHSPEGHALSLLKNLYDQMKNGQFCDVDICIGQHRFTAHKTVLCAASSYFIAMFCGGLRESSKNEVTIQKIEPGVFQNLLDFVYTGKLVITDENCQDLLVASNMFQLRGALTLCCEFLKKQMHTSNCIGIQQFAESQSCMDLSVFSTSFIHKNFLRVTKEEEFCYLPKVALINLLQSEQLHISNEFQVFEAAMKWILYRHTERREHVFEVLAPVRFPIISPQKLDKYINDCPDPNLKSDLRKMTRDFNHKRMFGSGREKSCLFMTRKCARKSIYVIGGYSREEDGRWSDSQSLGTVECFNTFHEQWQAIPPLNHARSGHGVCVLDGIIYVVGGESDSLIYDHAECLDPDTNKWKLVANMTSPRCGLGVCVVDGEVYAVGGWVGSDIGGTVEKYNPEENVWSEVDTVQTPRFAMGVCEHQGGIYVVGGMSDLGGEMPIVECYTPSLREWRRLPSLALSRAYVAVVALEGCLYAVGGWNEIKGALKSVERYSFEEKRWTSVSPMSYARAGPGVAAVNGFLYAIGGRSSPNNPFRAPPTLKSVECYDPQNDVWFEIGPLPTGRCEAGVAVV